MRFLAHRLHFATFSLLLVTIPRITMAQDVSPVQQRLNHDLANGRPVVVHVVVALCDNDHQGILPVPEALGNGQDPGNNLYWGAMYGVRSFMTRQAGWRLKARLPQQSEHILDKIILEGDFERSGKSHKIYVVAEAWDGRYIQNTVERFLRLAAGHDSDTIRFVNDRDTVVICAGGASHLIAYLGHNGLMDYPLRAAVLPASNTPARNSVVLACASRWYFEEPLRTGGSQPLLLTNGLMAPEAYTLDAIIRAWASGANAGDVRKAAATAYSKYQRCTLRAAMALFSERP